MKINSKNVSLFAAGFLLWLSFAFFGNTRADFLDDFEKGKNNETEAGTLNFSLDSADDFSGAVDETQSAKRGIELKDDGTLDFQYSVKTSGFSGDLCDHLKLGVKFEGGSSLSEDDLKNFSYKIGDFSNPEKLEFEASLKSGATGWEGKECEFDLVFEGWQKSVANFDDSGFLDVEKIANVVESEDVELKNLVINEVYYDDSSSDDTGKEWVEMYNGTANPVDISGYELNAASGDYFVFPSGFSIGSEKFVIVHWNATGVDTLTDLFTGSPTNFDNMGNTSGWVALFKSSTRSKDTIVDYLEYGVAGQTWEATAESAAIWKSGDFIVGASSGHSLSRKSAGYDTNLPSDFKELSVPTPGS